jgi:hypothetical protein
MRKSQQIGELLKETKMVLRRLRVVCLAAVVACGVVANAARAADTVYTIFVDGRPLTENPKDTGGLSHDGVVFVDVVKINKAYSGLLTFSNAGHTVKVSIAKRTAKFSAGRLDAPLDGSSLKLSGAPFIYHGDFYVPVTAFGRLAKSKVTIDNAALTAKLVTAGAPAGR